jgi:hypothetical protein
MKKIYMLNLVLSCIVLFSLSSYAQPFTGGIYTAVTVGTWHTAGPGIWQGSEPPQNCSNCLIVLDVPGTITLNATINLSNNSALIVGGTGNTTDLQIGNSGTSDFAHSFSVIMANDLSNTTIKVLGPNSLVDAQLAGPYDGILTSIPSGGSTFFFKQIGIAPAAFQDNTVVNGGSSTPPPTLVSGSTLSSFGVLPIILADFSAVVANGAVDLAWTTDLEINSDHFVIQSSANAGASWTDIGTVAAKGTSALAVNYSFTESKAATGTSEFRLQMVDRDGKYSYSMVKAVHIGLMSSVSVYPNPATDYVNVVLSGDASVSANIRLINLAGQVLMEKNVSNAGGTTVPLAVNNFPQGSYLIMVTGSDGTKQVNKILISK